MSPTNAPHIDIVRSEDKETKLKTFIKTFIDEAATKSGPAAGPQVLLLVLRSLDSPVAKAVTALVNEHVLDIPIKAIFAMIERADLETAGGDASPFSSGNAMRLSRDMRLLDVHEQLVLGPTTSWIGDCMRRDPRKRDAYECFAADCANTARWATISFDRLWDKSQTIGAAGPGISPIVAEACAALAGDQPSINRVTTAG